MLLRVVMDASTWNELIASLPGAHLLQTWEWGQFKARYGWDPVPLVWYERAGRVELVAGEGLSQPFEQSAQAAALLLRRTLPLRGFADQVRVLYVPKGPLLRSWEEAGLRQRVLSDLTGFAKRQKAIFIKIDPDVSLGSGVPGGPDAAEDATGQAAVHDLQARGWRYSDEQVQLKNTVLIDLHSSLETLLASMKQKTRYNIRLAERKGVRIREGDEADFSMLYSLYAQTSLRDGFVIRDENYYRDEWQRFMHAGMAEPLIAEVEGQMVAALVLYRFGRRAWYLQGMSSLSHREKMPNYLLQWEAIKRAKEHRCTVYDLWGAPDRFDESDAMWGVYRFKEGLGGRVVRHIGAWDYPARRFYYRFYTRVLPKILDLMRQRGIARTRSALSE